MLSVKRGSLGENHGSPHNLSHVEWSTVFMHAVAEMWAKYTVNNSCLSSVLGQRQYILTLYSSRSKPVTAPNQFIQTTARHSIGFVNENLFLATKKSISSYTEPDAASNSTNLRSLSVASCHVSKQHQ